VARPTSRAGQQSRPDSPSTGAETYAYDLEVLKLALADLQHENQRLRDARGSISRQLGPLPVSAALVAALVTAFPGSQSGSPWQQLLTAVALLAFFVMVVLSMAYSALTPYRKLRDTQERDPTSTVQQTVPATA
jgi:hypothetical protein